MDMDERRLTSLLHMAREAEAFDRELNGAGAIRHTAGKTRARRDVVGRAIWVSLASAACLALSVTVMQHMKIVPPNPNPSRAMIHKANPDRAVNSPAAASQDRQTMLIALYRGDDGRGATCPDCWCMQRWVPELDSEHELTGAASDEMICASMARSCVKDPAHVVVVGLSGPPESLPATDDTAREIAICLMEYQASKDAARSEPQTLNATIGALASASCVASSVDVHIQSWSR